MPSTAKPEEGTVHTFERTFSHEDVEQFGEVSGDQQEIHTEPDEQGRLVVQGLLTATLPTKIGGDLGVLARTMEFEFFKPVYTGETITCEVTTEAVEEREDRYDIASSVVCYRKDNTTARGEVPVSSAERSSADHASGRSPRADEANGSTKERSSSGADRENDEVMRARFEGVIWKE